MKSLFIALLLALPVTILAQPNYHEGYVLKNNGDTLKGFINYREWQYSPESIEFRANKNDGQVSTFSPQNIRGFQITGFENYVSYVGLVSVNKNVFPNLPSSLDTTRQPGSIFLKQLAGGEHVTLYFNNEVNKSRFFIAEKNEAPVELGYYEYYGPSNNDVVIDNLYRGQLILLITKYNNADKKLLASLADVGFEEHDLVNMSERINNIVPGSKTDSLRHDFKSKFRVFGGIGLNEFTTRVDAAIQNVLKPKFDFGIDFFTNPHVQQFTFRMELALSTLGAQYNQAVTPNSGAVNLSYTGYYITIAPQILFAVYNKENFKIYIDGGFAFNVVSYSHNQNGGDNGNIVGYATALYVPVQAGIIINKKYELSFTFSNFTTVALYSSDYVSNKLNGGIGLKMLF